MGNNPLVSIIIPVYNGSDYMQEAIDSALAQTYKNIEVIVVNDGSTDGGATDRIARAYGDKIRYFPKSNGGVSSALNKGIEEMSGEYFSWLSHDDVYEADKVRKQVETLKEAGCPENTIVYCNYMHIDEHSEPLTGMIPTVRYQAGVIYDSTEILTKLLTKETFNGCGLLIPQKVFAQCGGFDERFRFCQDALMWYKIFAKNYALVYTNEVLVKNRVHAKQLTQTGQALFRKECQQISRILVKEFAEISTKEHNFLSKYLLSDARYFTFARVRKIIEIGKEQGLIDCQSALKAYLICGYGYIRPFIRKLYYAAFRRIKTA